MRRWGFGLLAVLIAGCGGSDAKSPDETAKSTASEAKIIRKTMLAGKREATDGSARKTCRYITVAGQRRAIDAYNFTFQKQLRSCLEMVRFARKTEAEYLSNARRATVRRVRVRGRRASVVIEGPRSGPGDPMGALLDFYLRKVDGRWKVDNAPQLLPAGR
jgi:hypothetical protein